MERSRPSKIRPWQLAVLIGVAVLGTIGVATYAARARGAADVASTAQRNAALVSSLEAWLGLEPVMSWGAQFGAGRSGSVAAVIYSVGYWPFLLAGLAISLRSGPRQFQRTLLSVALSGLAGLTVMAWFPVAPPRLLGELDVIAKHEMSAFAHPDGLINPYAAMPSFHVGWSLISALAIGAAMPRARRIALAYPAVMSIVVVITGNHHVLDLFVGASIALAAWWFCGTSRCAALLAPGAEQGARGGPDDAVIRRWALRTTSSVKVRSFTFSSVRRASDLDHLDGLPPADRHR